MVWVVVVVGCGGVFWWVVVGGFGGGVGWGGVGGSLPLLPSSLPPPPPAPPHHALCPPAFTPPAPPPPRGGLQPPCSYFASWTRPVHPQTTMVQSAPARGTLQWAAEAVSTPDTCGFTLPTRQGGEGDTAAAQGVGAGWGGRAGSWGETTEEERRCVGLWGDGVVGSLSRILSTR